MVEVPCGGDLYFTIGSNGGATLQQLNWTVTPPTMCAVDAGTGGGAGGGGGTGGGGGGSATGGGSGGVVMLPWIGPSSDGKNAGGCGCNATDGTLVVVAGLVLLAIRRKRG
jgi:MYXO-CTERM domain-containing protein